LVPKFFGARLRTPADDRKTPVTQEVVGFEPHQRRHLKPASHKRCGFFYGRKACVSFGLMWLISPKV